MSDAVIQPDVDMVFCPFCGSFDIQVQAPYRGVAICAGCLARGPFKPVGPNTPETAVVAWNTRVPMVGDAVPPTFNQWFDEPQTVTTRRERFERCIRMSRDHEDVLEMLRDWVKASFVAGATLPQDAAVELGRALRDLVRTCDAPAYILREEQALAKFPVIGADTSLSRAKATLAKWLGEPTDGV